MSNSSANGCVWKSIAAGAAGGLIASYAMNQFQALLSKASEPAEKKQQPEKQEKKGDDATVKTAKAISHGIFEHELTDEEKKWAGPAVHYSLGTSLGAAYGALAAKFPVVEAGCGTAYGSAVWLGADEVAVPAFGLSQSPSETPLSSHVSALASHLVFGFVTGLTRKLLLSNLKKKF